MCTKAESFVISRVMTAGILSTIPSEIGLLTQMIALAISDDTVFGTIPSTMGMLTKLEYLRIYNT